MSLDLDIDRLKNRTAQLGDDELLKIAFTNAHEYQPIAIEIAREELSKRGIAVEVVVTDPAGTRLPPTEPKYKGVAGWLYLFCLSLTVFNPLITFGSLAADYSNLSQYFFPGLRVIAVIDTLLSFGLVAFSIYAGVSLWRVKPGAVQTAKRFLWCSLAYTAVAFILTFMAGLPSEVIKQMIPEVIGQTFRNVLYFTIWYLYLDNSERVKATFGL